MIRIEEIKENPPVEIFDPNGNSIGSCKTELQFLRLRCQIKRAGVSGYYFFSKGIKYTINNLGYISPGLMDENYPFVTSDKYLDYIINLTNNF